MLGLRTDGWITDKTFGEDIEKMHHPTTQLARDSEPAVAVDPQLGNLCFTGRGVSGLSPHSLYLHSQDQEEGLRERAGEREERADRERREESER
jgi:hypothetical protein